MSKPTSNRKSKSWSSGPYFLRINKKRFPVLCEKWTTGMGGDIELFKTYTVLKIKFFIKDSFSKCDQICSFLRIWSHLLKKYSMENFIFCVVLSLVVVSTKCQKSVKKAVTCVARGDILEENSALEIYIEGMTPENCQLFVDEINRGALVKPSDLVYPIYALILIYR